MAEAQLQGHVTPGRSHDGVVDRAVGWLERLPGTGVPWIVAGAIVLDVVAHGASWISGEASLGDLRPELLFPVPFLIFFLVLIVILDGVASSSFDDFQPSLNEPAEAIQRLRSDLTSIPDVQAIVAIILWALVVNVAGGDPSNTVALPPTTATVVGILWFLTNAALALLIVHTLHQLRQVGRLQAMVARVNLLDPDPINAFSRLTAATAGGILTVGVLFAVVDPNDPSPFALGVELVITAIAAAFFVFPLRGMHHRLAGEKRRLLGDANARLQLVIDRIHKMVDADDLARADELQKTETALLAERDLYLRLSTWPWSTGTFRAFASAVLLPIFLGIVLRLVTRVI